MHKVICEHFGLFSVTMTITKTWFGVRNLTNHLSRFVWLSGNANVTKTQGCANSLEFRVHCFHAVKWCYRCVVRRWLDDIQAIFSLTRCLAQWLQLNIRPNLEAFGHQCVWITYWQVVDARHWKQSWFRAPHEPRPNHHCCARPSGNVAKNYFIIYSNPYKCKMYALRTTPGANKCVRCNVI